LALLSALLLCAVRGHPQWLEFRGPGGMGHADSPSVPLRWSEKENIIWKTPIPGLGWSSPVISGGQIWLTSAAGAGMSLRAICVDPQTGEILHNVEVFRLASIPAIHEKNSYASPTPILEADRVYVHFGALGTAALNRSGEILWKNQNLGYRHGHGPGGSPALSGDLLVINGDGTDQQFVAALDKNTGEVRWKTPRVNSAMAYTTPLVIPRGEGKQVFSVGSFHATSYDLESGKALWWVDYDGYSVVPRPVFAGGVLFFTTGFYTPVLIAVRADGSGNVTASHVLWTWHRGVPLTPSPLVVGSELYIVSDNGIATCLDVKTGKEHWRRRLGGNFSASPLFAAGRIYFSSEEGETTVIKPGPVFEQLAVNRIDGRTLASLAVDGKTFYLRSDTHLYRIEEEE
jgi:outer membrane protein assembly factor BamB